MTTFIEFRDALGKQFSKLEKAGNLFQSNIEKDVLWDKYLEKLDKDEHGNLVVFRERGEHDCQCCKRYIRNIGRILGNINGEVVSVFDNLNLTGEYAIVAKTLAKANKEAGISGIYLNDEQTVGQRESYEERVGGEVHTWQHFYQVLPTKAYSLAKDIGTRKGKAQTNCKVLKRSITELTEDSVDTVIELIDQNSLHRGSEFIGIVKGLKSLQEGYATATSKELFLWDKTLEMQTNNYDCNIRGTAIGTLLVDLSNDVELEVAVKKYEDKVSGTNYKRTSALVTPRMKEDAKNKAKELGIEPSFPRRFANKGDLKTNDVLFADNSVKPFMEDSLFDMVATTKTSGTKGKNFDKVEEMTMDQFITNILPKAESVELFLENKHESNLMSLIAPVNETAPCIMKWGNNFSWNYKGEVAESDLKTKVQKMGGRVDGVLRFSHTWNYDGKNQSLMDLHVFLPNHNGHSGGVSDTYGNSNRVGWNQREHLSSGGVQDVDFVNPPIKEIPVENITFPSMDKLQEGKYVFKIHNWNKRNPTTSGFKAEIELNGEVFQYEYTKTLGNKEWITVAEATLKGGVFTIKHHLPESNKTKVLWGINTGEFHKVDMVMKSPNYWEDSGKTGNEHLFFILDKCVTKDSARGMYNEFLIQELQPHRKVFEILASQLKAEYSEDQLSGVGFSSTLRNQVTLRVKGSFNRVIKVNF